LFLAADPSAAKRLALDEECAAIDRELRMTASRDHFDFHSRWAVSVDEMMRSLNELQPSIIHFSGHGSCDVQDPQRPVLMSRDIATPAAACIQLVDERGQPQLVSADALTAMIQSAAPSARLVVLNACFSDAIAESLRRAVDYVIGMAGEIADAAARVFAVSLYRALGNLRSVGNAVEQAVATMMAHRLPDAALPVCWVRPGVDALRAVLPGLPRSRHRRP
jgi:hypothetical protein